MSWFWNLELFTSPVQPVTVAITLLLLAVVVWCARGRGRRHRRWFSLVLAAGLGALACGLSVWILQEQNLFDGDLPEGSAPWIVGAGAAIGLAVLGLISRPWWNRILAVLLLLASLLSMGLQVNRLYGLTNTPGLIFGVQTGHRAHLPHVVRDPAKDKVNLTNWRPPAGMPSKGSTGLLTGGLGIPASRPYASRPASVYLPPAALVRHPPRLPVMVVMMGQPGSPDPTRVAAALDAYAARNQGLAPIAVVVDQLAGSPENDPICRDSETFGAVSTFVNADTVAYIKKRLNVLDDRRDWAIAGYSNGGSCAWQWATEFPGTWGAVLDVSGNEFPGSQHQAAAIKNFFGGSAEAYHAWLPAGQLRRHAGAFDGHLASFTWGGDDAKYGPAARANAQAAQAAGFNVKTHGIDGAGHVGAAATTGLALVVQDFGDDTGLTRRP